VSTLAVDTNILVDSLTFGSESRRRLATAGRIGQLIICEVVQTELASFVGDESRLIRFLKESRVVVERSTAGALVNAGLAWRRYTERRPDGLTCADCGMQQRAKCQGCGAALRGRQHIVADFMIGAHALVQADGLLTRDRRYFTTYFPDLTLV
jgi:predicted nucleic acid-binding protein